jgi:hypothetical protein
MLHKINAVTTLLVPTACGPRRAEVPAWFPDGTTIDTRIGTGVVSEWATNSGDHDVDSACTTLFASVWVIFTVYSRSGPGPQCLIE